MKSYVQPHMAESLEDHVLETICFTDSVKVYRMRRPGTMMMRVQITFTPEGIAIQGDCCPQLHGVCSALGYGLSWFAKRLSEGYLCEKFLSREWQQEVAVQDIADQLSMAQEDLNKAIETEAEGRVPPETREEVLAGTDFKDESDAFAMWQAVQDGFHADTGPEGLYEIASPLIDDFWDYAVGMDYNLADAGWLCAIQQRFSELWKTQNPAREKTEAPAPPRSGERPQGATEPTPDLPAEPAPLPSTLSDSDRKGTS